MDCNVNAVVCGWWSVLVCRTLSVSLPYDIPGLRPAADEPRKLARTIVSLRARLYSIVLITAHIVLHTRSVGNNLNVIAAIYIAVACERERNILFSAKTLT